jgi:hypothetical protein
MNKTQAELLASKLTTSFQRTNIDATAWVEYLEPLDHEVAKRVVDYVIRGYDKQPTIAQFLSEYHRHAESDTDMSKFRPDPGAISFDQYLARIVDKASRGDREATEMVGIWERYLEARSL